MTINPNIIRKKFAANLSNMFSREVDEYSDFVNIVKESNLEYVQKNPEIKESVARIIEEKHGAIRVGTAFEINILTRIFAIMGMEPVNFYDLSEIKTNPMPVIATAFRPISQKDLAISPFRMFCSMLHLENRKFFSETQEKRAKEELKKRHIFSKGLLKLIDRIEKNGGVEENQLKDFLSLTTSVFRMDEYQIIDFELYKDFRLNVNDVAADVACFARPHINHLTPRALDIFDALEKVKEAGIPTIDNIQGPLKRENEQALPLLNQVSRKAAGEFIYCSNDPEFVLKYRQDSKLVSRLQDAGKIESIETIEEESNEDYFKRCEEALLATPDKVIALKHKARFGEMEQRGVALTAEGRKAYDEMMANGTYLTDFPKTHQELFEKKYAYYKKDSKGVLIPIEYDDFLPKSAAGIFMANLSGETVIRDSSITVESSENQKTLEIAMHRKVIDSYSLYEKEVANA